MTPCARRLELSENPEGIAHGPFMPEGSTQDTSCPKTRVKALHARWIEPELLIARRLEPEFTLPDDPNPPTLPKDYQKLESPSQGHIRSPSNLPDTKKGGWLDG